MIIDVIENSCTKEDKEQLKSYYSRINELFSLMQKEIASDSEDIQGSTKRFESYNREINAVSEKIRAIYDDIERRYAASFEGDINAILDAARDVANAITKQDFEDHQTQNAKYCIKPAEDSNKEDKKKYEKSKKECAKNWENCCDYIIKNLNNQLFAIDYYYPKSEENKETRENIWKEIQEIARKRADEFYSRPQRLTKTATKHIETAILSANADYYTIRQGPSTNLLTKINPILGKNMSIDPITGDATITKGDFSLTVKEYADKAGLKTSTYQLLDAITIAFTESGAKSATVNLSLDSYMQMRGLKDRKEAKKQAISDMEILRKASISGTEKRGKQKEAYNFVNLADSGEVTTNGDIVFTFGQTFYKMLIGYTIMPYPADLLSSDNKRHPSKYYIERKLTEHQNMNPNKENESIIAVKSLLESTPTIPSYETVMSKDRHLDRKIIEPFEKCMDSLNGKLDWNYCHSKNTPLSDDELETMNYDMFIGLLVHIKWKNYPDQQARLERKKEAVKKSSRKKTKSAQAKT